MSELSWRPGDIHDGEVVFWECPYCGSAQTFIEGNPEENKYWFCPECGHDMRMAPKAKVYISGAISDDPDYKEKFRAAHQMLEECGFEVLDPTELVKVSPEKDYTDYLSEAVWHMLKADELYMLKGWSQSTGAKLELKLARLLNKRVQFQ